MKKIMLLLIIVSLSADVMSQNTSPWPSIGNIGIGTANPQSRLHIYQSAADAPGLIVQGNTISSDNVQHYTAITLDGDYGNATGNYSQIRSYSNLHANWGSRLAFFTTQGDVANTLVERMRIRENGNVGIGTSHPVSKFSIGDYFVEGGNSTRLERNILISQNTYNDQILAAHSVEHNLWAGLSTAYHISTLSNSNILTKRFTIDPQGNIGIGTTDAQGYKLAVNGNMIAEAVNVKLRGSWPDHVFEKGYKLNSLPEIEKFIAANRHLPGIPSASQVQKDGIDLGEMNAKLLEKIEELTLHLVALDKKLEKQDLLIKKLLKDKSN